MKTDETYPRIQEVQPGDSKTLLVTFDNGVKKRYDCTPLLQTEPFRPLEDEALFFCAHADSNGYAVIWNDDIDLAESEIWLNGEDAEIRR